MQADQIYSESKIDAFSQTEEKSIGAESNYDINYNIPKTDSYIYDFEYNKRASEHNSISVMVSTDSNTDPQIIFKSKLSCPVCLNAYNEYEFIPKILSCGHTLCNVCLQSINSRGPMICPLCKHQERRSIINIPTNFAIYEVNKACKGVEFCEFHNREAGLYCKTDHSILCFDCVKSHLNHEIYSFSDRQISIIDEENKKAIDEIEFSLTNCVSNYEEIFSQIKWDIERIEELREKHLKGFKEAKVKIQKTIINVMENISQNIIKNHNEAAVKSHAILEIVNNAIIEADEKYQKFAEEKKRFEKANMLQRLGWKFNYDLSLDPKEFDMVNLKFIEESEKPIDYLDKLLAEIRRKLINC